MSEPYPFTTVALPDGIVVGGPWPHTTVAWPGGKGRSATKPEYDLFQALEKATAENDQLRKLLGASLEDTERMDFISDDKHLDAVWEERFAHETFRDAIDAARKPFAPDAGA